MTATNPDAAPGQRAPLLARSVPWLIMGTGALHTQAAVTKFPRMLDPNPFTGLLDDGLIGAVVDHTERHAELWFLLCGLFLILFGHLLHWTVLRTGRVPALVGWWLIGLGVPIVVLLPASGGWLLLAIGVLALVAARRTRPSTASR